MYTKEKRPWGYFEVLLDDKNCKVKRIVVNPGAQLSYQYHQHRGEMWTVIESTATVTLNDVKIAVLPEHSISIPLGTPHRVKNDTDKPLVFIEVQTGSYFGEDDIVRIEDDYNRV